MKRHESWFIQAQSDLRAAEGLFDLKLYSHTCFMCQQVAEKCLKSVAYSRDIDFVKGHSLIKIAQDLKINGTLEEAARTLDVYYISARYPDALPDHVAPVVTFGENQAREAIKMARVFVERTKGQI